MDPPADRARNADQIAYWKGPGGQRWIDRQETQDTFLTPVLDALLEHAQAVAGVRVIDVGCGCGASAIAFARRVGTAGHVLGIDVSGPMLARARDLAPPGAPVEFVLADATVHPFARDGLICSSRASA